MSIRSLILPLALASSALFSPAAHAETVPGKQATEHGFLACQAVVERIAKFLAEDNEHGAVSTWHSKTPDTRLFNSQVVVKYADGYAVATINVAPTKAGKCDASYSMVFTSEKSCPVMRDTTFKDWKFFAETGGLVSLENKTGNVSAVLQPSATGCTAVRTEVVYD